MKKKFLIASAATVFGTSAMAQSAFEGFYGQVGTGYQNNTGSNLSSSYSVYPANGGTETGNAIISDQTAQGVPLVLGLGYMFPISGPWLIGLGADYSFLPQKTGSFTVATTDTLGSSTLTGHQIEVSNSYNIFVTTGYAIDKDKLAYIKLGYSSQQSKYTAPTQSVNEDPAYSFTSTTNGYILGLGYKQVISGSLYGFAEANYMSYSKLSKTLNLTATNNTYTSSSNINSASSAYTLLVGIGYKF